jgi:hypothetical protein
MQVRERMLMAGLMIEREILIGAPHWDWRLGTIQTARRNCARRKQEEESVMKDESANPGPAAGAPGLPAAFDRATFQAELDALRVREKAHTREGDAIAAARRRLPMVEMDPGTPLTGPRGPLTLLDAFEADGGAPTWPPVSAWPGGRPIGQWSRLEAGRSDDLAVGP